jgi:molybdopterin-guanine dinucleotide biosynthesis protein A
LYARISVWRWINLLRSAIILAGGSSTRFNTDKGVLELNGKPLLNHVIDAVKELVEEVIVVTNTQARADAYSKLVSESQVCR